MNRIDRKNLEALRLKLCEGQLTDEEGEKKVVCREGLLKKTYKKFRCACCEAIDTSGLVGRY